MNFNLFGVKQQKSTAITIVLVTCTNFQKENKNQQYNCI